MTKDPLPWFLPLSVAVGLGSGSVGSWQVFLRNPSHFLLFDLVLIVGAVMAALLASMTYLIHKFWKQSRELSEGKELMDRMFDGAADAFLMTDRNGLIFRINPQAEHMFGFASGELIGKPVEELVPEHIRNLHRTHRERYYSAPLSRAMGKELELYGRRKDGSRFRTEIALTPVQSKRGIRVMAVITDITERKAAENKLLEQAALLELAHDAIVVRDLEGRITFWNQGATKTYGWTAEEARGQFISRLLQTNYPTTLEEVEVTVGAQGKWEGELEQTTRDGKTIVVASKWSLQRDSHGKPLAFLEVNRDITERKHLEAELEANKLHLISSERLSAVGMMAGGVAHEINTPLGIIYAVASDLIDSQKEGEFAPADLVENYTLIRDTVIRINRIIKSLRAVAGIGVREELRPVPINKIIEEALDVCKQRFKDNSINLISPEFTPVPIVTCNEVQVLQILLNLLQNAFDAVEGREGEKWVRIDTETHDNFVAITVTDSGSGIPPQIRSRMMEPFFTTKDIGKGTGLGLSISKTLAEEHGGKLEYCDNQPNTCFRLELPLIKESACA